MVAGDQKIDIKAPHRVWRGFSLFSKFPNKTITGDFDAPRRMILLGTLRQNISGTLIQKRELSRIFSLDQFPFNRY
jgi:hypothetical protein